MNILIALNLILTVALCLIVGRPLLRRNKVVTRGSFETAVADAAAILREASMYLDIEKQARLSRPIHHDPIVGPRTAKVTDNIGYWVPKDDPRAEPFLAAWYERDTTWMESGSVFSPMDSDLTVDGVRAKYRNVAQGNIAPGLIPADTYVDLTGRKIPGAVFRALHDPAPTIMEVAKFKARAARLSSNVVGHTSAPSCSLEEEQQLAEEYELGKTPTLDVEGTKAV